MSPWDLLGWVGATVLAVVIVTLGAVIVIAAVKSVAPVKRGRSQRIIGGDR